MFMRRRKGHYLLLQTGTTMTAASPREENSKLEGPKAAGAEVLKLGCTSSHLGNF